MSELKTLKDLEGYSDGFDLDYVNCRELRAEAVKWVKETEKQMIKYGSPQVNTVKWTGLTSMKTQKHFIKGFFNLTEEDLGDTD